MSETPRVTLADIEAAMAIVPRHPTAVWEAHPDVIAKAAEMGVTVDELVRMAMQANGLDRGET